MLKFGKKKSGRQPRRWIAGAGNKFLQAAAAVAKMLNLIICMAQ